MSDTVIQPGLMRGTVRHRRFRPHPHGFEYNTAMALLDLENLAPVFEQSSLWSQDRMAPIAFKDQDYLPQTQQADVSDSGLAARIRQAAAAGVGEPVDGPIDVTGAVELLAQLRHWGMSFNPVVFYFLHDQAGELSVIGAEITNTPWSERHTYWLPVSAAEPIGQTARNTLRFRFGKDFHVSPFLPMDLNYDWRFSFQPQRLLVHMQVHQPVTEPESGASKLMFDATLHLDRVAYSPENMRRMACGLPGPMMTTVKIYWQALRLWLRRTPFFGHPRTRQAGEQQKPSVDP